jgi:hypothetical protein
MEDKRIEFKKKWKEFDRYLPQHCQNCEYTEDLSIHHVVPLVLGGNNVIGNLIRLCEKCHQNIHDKGIGNKRLQREGVERAKKAGKYKGMPKKYTDNHEGLQKALILFRNRDKNRLTVAEIVERTGVSRPTIYREIKRQKHQIKE